MEQFNAEQLNAMTREELIRALSASQSELAATKNELSANQIELTALNNDRIVLSNQVKSLEEKLKKALRKLFGYSSEHVAKDMDDPAEQLSFFANEAEMWSDIEAKEEKKAAVTAHTRRTRKRENLVDILPEGTEVEVIPHYPGNTTCPNCGEEMAVLGTEVKRSLVIVPAQVKIREDVYYNYKCSKCTVGDENTVIVESEKIPTVIPGSYASPEAIAYILSQKYVMASPLYRMEQELNRQGVMLSRQTMSNWQLEGTNLWLKPLYEALRTELLKEEILHADETTIQVLREPHKKAQTKSYMWLYRTGRCAEMPIVLYEYKDSRSAKHPQRFLEGFHGYLHADGYAGYHTLTDMTIVGCLAHARRKFYDAMNVSSPAENVSKGIAEEAVRRFDEISSLDKEYADLPAEERYRKRLEEIQPRLIDMLRWLKECNAAPKFALGRAVAYLEGQFNYLLNVFKDGRLELTNNRAERSIKPFVIGRKNWLFANTPKGAQSSAIAYSIIETAKENGLDPYKYLLYIFQEAPKLAAVSDDWAEKFLPSKVPDICKA